MFTASYKWAIPLLCATLLASCSSAEKLGCIEGLRIEETGDTHTVYCKQLQFTIQCQTDSLVIAEGTIYCRDKDGVLYEIQEEIEGLAGYDQLPELEKFMREKESLWETVKKTAKKLFQKAGETVR